MRISVLIENDLERLEQSFSRDACFMPDVFKRAWLIAFRRLLLSGKIDRCVVDILLCGLKAAHSAEDALCRVKSNISCASASAGRLEELHKVETEAIDNYHKAIAAASVTFSRVFIGANFEDELSIETKEPNQ